MNVYWATHRCCLFSVHIFTHLTSQHFRSQQAYTLVFPILLKCSTHLRILFPFFLTNENNLKQTRAKQTHTEKICWGMFTIYTCISLYPTFPRPADNFICVGSPNPRKSGHCPGRTQSTASD